MRNTQMLFEQWQQHWHDNVRRVLIWGAGGHSREIAACVLDRHSHILVKSNWPADPASVYIDEDQIESMRVMVDGVHVAIGDNRIRSRWLASFAGRGWNVLTVISKHAAVAHNVTLGQGCYIAPGAVVQSGVRLGDGVVVNSGAIISHDCELDAYCQISPGACLCGHVHVHACACIYAGATVTPGCQIGIAAQAGAGSLIRHDIPAHQTWVGVPAKWHKYGGDSASKWSCAQAVGSASGATKAEHQGKGNS